MKTKAKLPRGIRRRGNSLVLSFALADGTIERRSVGLKSLQSAERERLNFMHQVAEGTYQKKQPRLPEPIEPVAFKVQDLWDAYLVEYRNRSGKDTGRLEIAWNRLKDMFANCRVADVATHLVNTYIAARRAQGMANGTVNREVATLRAAFMHGTRVSPPMVDRVPAFPSRLKESAPRKGFVTDAEYAKLAANAKDLSLRCLIAAAFTFGFRKGELLNLRVRQVDLLDRWMELEEGTTKNGEARKVRMTGEVFELMKECVRGKKPDDYVFTREAGSQVVDPRDEWYSLCVSSGLGKYEQGTRKNGKKYNRYVGLNLHDFRRSAIRNMTRRGVNDTTAMKISGHKTRSVFMRYNIVDERDLAEAARLIEAGRQVDFSGEKTDTKSDTSTYAHS
jgi:integrase